MGDEEEAHLRLLGTHLSHALRDHPQSVDVEPGVCLVEHRQVRREEGHLEDLVAFLLAAREALVQVARSKTLIHLQTLHPLHE